jgi:hypothetical protein
MDPKMVEVLGNLGLRFLEQVMKQQATSGSWQQQQIPTQIPPGFGVSPGPFWPPAIPPVFNPGFDPSGFCPVPTLGWNGNPWPFY